MVVEKRRFMFVVAIHLAKLGWLDDKNKPTSEAIRKTSEVCGPYEHISTLTVKNFFPRADPDNLFFENEGFREIAEVPVVDYKSILNAHLQRKLRKQFKLDFKYEGTFKAYLRLDMEYNVDPPEVVYGEEMGSKKAAVQSCSKEILEDFYPEALGLERF